MADAASQHRPFDTRDWNVDGKKISKELKTFDGDLAMYVNWRLRVRNNCNYSRVFELVEANKVAIV